MAWESVTWACGHEGRIQLTGPQRNRNATVAREAGKDCMACWLVGQWEATSDPRAARPDRLELAASIAESRGKRINVARPQQANPLAEVADSDLLAECRRRGLIT